MDQKLDEVKKETVIEPIVSLPISNQLEFLRILHPNKDVVKKYAERFETLMDISPEDRDNNELKRLTHAIKILSKSVEKEYEKYSKEQNVDKEKSKTEHFNKLISELKSQTDSQYQVAKEKINALIENRGNEEGIKQKANEQLEKLEKSKNGFDELYVKEFSNEEEKHKELSKVSHEINMNINNTNKLIKYGKLLSGEEQTSKVGDNWIKNIKKSNKQKPVQKQKLSGIEKLARKIADIKEPASNTDIEPVSNEIKEPESQKEISLDTLLNQLNSLTPEEIEGNELDPEMIDYAKANPSEESVNAALDGMSVEEFNQQYALKEQKIKIKNNILKIFND